MFVIVKLFTALDGEPSSLVEMEGDLPADKALSRALCTVYQYLVRHVLGNADFDPSDTL